MQSTERTSMAWRSWLSRWRGHIHSLLQEHRSQLTLEQHEFGLCEAVYVGFLPINISSAQSLSRVRLFVTPWTAAHQASLSITNLRSPPKPMSIESVMPSTISPSVVPFSSHLQSFPASGSFQVSQIFASGGQNIGVSASTSVLPMNAQDWFPLGWTGWISLQSNGLSRVFSNTTIQKQILWCSAFFIVQLSHPYTTTGKTMLWLDGPLLAK